MWESGGARTRALARVKPFCLLCAILCYLIFRKDAKAMFCFCFSSGRSRTLRAKRTLRSVPESLSCKKDALADRKGRFWLGSNEVGKGWEEWGKGQRDKCGEACRAGAARPRPGRAGKWGRGREGHGSARGLRRSFSALSPRFSACGSIMKHFLPLCHWAPPSFSMEELLSFLLGTERWKGSAFVAFVACMPPFP